MGEGKIGPLRMRLRGEKGATKIIFEGAGKSLKNGIG